MHNVLILGSIDHAAVESLQADPLFAVTNLNDSLKKGEGDSELLKKALICCDIVVTRSETTIDKDFLEKTPQLKMVMRAAVGVANIDLELCSARGIVVANSPALNSTSAAEQAFILLLCCLRKTYQACATMKNGGWNRHLFEGRELKNKSVALVGLGNVGSLVAKYCLSFGAEVKAYDPYVSSKKFQSLSVIPCASLEELCKDSDILSLHTPLNSETKEMINAEHIELMNKAAVVVNAARGGLIHEQILLTLLEGNKIAALGLDTFSSEPHYFKELAHHQNVICTPHIGASTSEAKSNIGNHVVAQLRKFSQYQTVDTAVNADFSLQGVSLIVRSYAALSEKLGFILAQLIRKDPGEENRTSSIKIVLRGDLSLKEAESIIKTRFCMGYLQNKTNKFVSMINAVALFTELGLDLEFISDPDFTDYRSALKIETFNKDTKILRTIGGVVFGEDELRFTTLDHFAFDLSPSGHFLALKNEDKPGVVGEVGQYLGRRKVNIECFYLAKKPGTGQEALSIVKLDKALSNQELEDIEKLSFIRSARAFHV